MKNIDYFLFGIYLTLPLINKKSLKLLGGLEYCKLELIKEICK